MNTIFTKASTFLICYFVVQINGVLAQIDYTNSISVVENFNDLGSGVTTPLPDHWLVSKSDTANVIKPYSEAKNKVDFIGGNSLTTFSSNGIYRLNANNNVNESAIGGMSSSDKSLSVVLYTSLINNSSDKSSTKFFEISYDIEKYRKGSNAIGSSVKLWYSLDGDNYEKIKDFRQSYVPDIETVGYAISPDEEVTSLSKLFRLPAGKVINYNERIYFAWTFGINNGSYGINSQMLSVDNILITPLAKDESICETPSFVKEPENFSATLSSTATFDCETLDISNFKWQSSSDDGKTWVTIRSSLSKARDTFSISSITSSDEDILYRVIIENECKTLGSTFDTSSIFKVFVIKDFGSCSNLIDFEDVYIGSGIAYTTDTFIKDEYSYLYVGVRKNVAPAIDGEVSATFREYVAGTHEPYLKIESNNGYKSLNFLATSAFDKDNFIEN